MSTNDPSIPAPDAAGQPAKPPAMASSGEPDNGELRQQSTRAPYLKPELKRLGALEVITQGSRFGSFADRRSGSRRKVGRR